MELGEVLAPFLQMNDCLLIRIELQIEVDMGAGALRVFPASIHSFIDL